MKEIYVISNKTTGRIKESNKINREWDSNNLDGSTITEYIENILNEQPDIQVNYFINIELPNKNDKKIVAGEIVPLSEEELSEYESSIDAENSRIEEIRLAQSQSGMKNDSVVNAQAKIKSIFDGIREKPTEIEKLNALINKTELLFKRIAVELLG